MTVDTKYAGEKFTIVHCEGALESFTKAISGLPKNKQGSFTRGMILQIQKLANGHPMSKENFPSEGLLPGTDHQAKRNFYALKRIPVRGYCWLSSKHPNTWFVSHYVH